MAKGRLRSLIDSDLYRHAGTLGLRPFLRHFYWTPGFRYVVLLRLYQHARERRRVFMRRMLSWLLHRYSIRYGISISADARIGAGFYIGHYGGIVVNEAVVIGDNCNLSHDVTIGQANRGAQAGCPVIGDNVYIGPGAKLFGRIRIGSHVAIGANSVVNTDLEDGCVAAGIPARVISREGSSGYVNRTDYPAVHGTEAAAARALE